jgi:ribonuclease E
MCVHVERAATHIAVLEGRALIEHFVARPQDDANQIVGNIYRGRVKNVLPGMEAAFVDIGTPKNAVLYWGDVSYDRDDVERQTGADRIEHLLRPGQTIVCQVTKNPIGLKGARLTQEVSPRRQRAAKAAAHPRRRPPGGPRPDREDRGCRCERRGPAP